MVLWEMWSVRVVVWDVVINVYDQSASTEACSVQKCGGVQKCVMCCEMWCGVVVWCGMGLWKVVV